MVPASVIHVLHGREFAQALVEQLNAAIAGTARAQRRIAVYHGPTPPAKREELKRAFNTNVDAALEEWRTGKGLAPDPLDAFRQSGYHETATEDRRVSRSVMAQTIVHARRATTRAPGPLDPEVKRLLPERQAAHT